jgi:adenosylhomocysteine nucleosidase
VAVLIVAAEAREFDGLLRHCANVRRLRWGLDYAAEAKLNGSQAVLVANGPGPALAGEAVAASCRKQDFTALVSTGFCGALDPKLRCGTILVASAVDMPGRQASWPASLPQTEEPYVCGRLWSSDSVVQTAAEKARLRATGACAVEMEAAGVAVSAAARSLPVYCVRVVLDRADEGFALDFNLMRRSDGRFSRARIMRAALARPWRLVPELIRIHRRSRVASRALGDFIADCRF